MQRLQTRNTRGLTRMLVCAVLLPACFAQIQPGQLAPKPLQPGQTQPGQIQSSQADADRIQPGQVAPSASSNSNPDAPPRSDIVVPVNVVIAPTTVLDRRGNYVNGLQIQDFSLFDNGKEQRITQDVSFEPMSIVVAVQASANLNDILPKIQRVGIAVDNLIVGQEGEAAVLAFDHRLRVMQDFTTDPDKIQEAMRKITPGSSNHAVIDAVVESVRMLRKRAPDRRRIIVLVSEKRDKGSEGRLREALTEAQFANVAIYSIDISSIMAGLTGTPQPPAPSPIPSTAYHLPTGQTATPNMVEQNTQVGNWIPLFVDIFKSVKSIFVDDTLDVFTRFTGGKEYSFVSQKDLEKATTALGEELHSQYLLSYSPNNLGEGGFHDIRVTVNRPGLEVRTRPGYWVAARPE